MYIAQTNSTSTLLRRLLSGERSAETAPYAACLEEAIPLLYTDFQTAGRGQTGNSWESEWGKNLLFSFALREPQVAINQQFDLSILVAVAMHRTIAAYLPEAMQAGLRIKWPNDIYYGDEKMAGILVENTLQGQRIAYSITGIGLNINQIAWQSGAPNPTSLRLITGIEHAPRAVLETYMAALRELLRQPMEVVREQYWQHLYRREGWHAYMEREVDLRPTSNASAQEAGAVFEAQIEAIDPMGELVLRTREGEERTYHFKQIRFVL